MPGYSAHSLGKSTSIILIPAAEDATSLSSHSDWLRHFCIQGVMKWLLVLVLMVSMDLTTWHWLLWIISIVQALLDWSAWYGLSQTEKHGVGSYGLISMVWNLLDWSAWYRLLQQMTCKAYSLKFVFNNQNKPPEPHTWQFQDSFQLEFGTLPWLAEALGFMLLIGWGSKMYCWYLGWVLPPGILPKYGK